MMNRLKLESVMKAKGVSVGELCQEIGMSRSAFYRKCRGITEFTHSEIEHIVTYLDLGTPMGIFFAEKVS